MHLSIILATLTAVAIAAPMEMNTMNAMKEAHQAADGSYGAYPGGVHEAAKAMGTRPFSFAMNQTKTSTDEASHMKRDNMNVNDMMNDAAVADMMRKESMMLEKAEIMKRDMMMKDADMMDAKQAADTSYGKYGAYGKYADYGKYPGGVEKEAQKMHMA
ncbi:hypothetical protein E8E11_008911 [Didymella keratinophila]|nr:hypothetical protein E8E11_008911 [Didymella keratinophila]